MHFVAVSQQPADTIAPMLSVPKVTALGLSVKLPIVLLRFIQRNSKALNCDSPKKYSDLSIIILDLSPKVRTKSRPMCMFSPT